MPDVRATAPLSASGDAYLHLLAKRAGKIKGESKAPDHGDDIAVTRWSWGVTASSSIGSGSATARRSYKHLVIDKRIDCASTALLSALATNDELREATLAMRRAGDAQKDYWRITLKKARVVAVDYDTNADGDTVERVSLSFTEVEAEYRVQEASGGRGAAHTFTDQIFPEA
jgi:type VI secretion system secreted protein Hcp